MIPTGVFHRTAIAAAVLTLTIGLGRPSGAPPQQSAERPLTVDFYALGPDGAAITDLKPEELTIRVASRARVVRSLRLVKQAELPSTDPLAPSADGSARAVRDEQPGRDRPHVRDRD